MSIKVMNISSASEDECRCGTWLRHWENHGGAMATMCVEKSCTKNAEVGSHVQRREGDDKNWYIVPLCRMHNSLYGKELQVMDSTRLVSANPKETCQKN